MKRAVRDIIIISVLLMLAMPAFIFAGAAEEAAPTGPIDIVYWRALTGAAGDAQDELVMRFNAAQTRVIAEAQFQGAYAELLQKLLAGLAAGSVPDVVLLDSPFVGLFAKDGALVSLDSFVTADKTDFDLTDYVPGLLQDGYYGKNLYALPFMRSTPLIYYNADLFREVGLPDRAPDTWEELKEFSQKLTKVENGETVRYGTAFTLSRSSAHWYFQGGVYAYGGQISDDQFGIHLQEAPAMAVAQLWQDMVMKDKIAIGSTDPHTEFLNGRVGIVFGSTGSMGSLMSRATFEVVGAFIPQKDQRLVPVGGSVLAMPSNDKTRQSGAWDFIKYMTNAASNSYVIQQTGYMPVTKSAADYPDTVAYYAQYPERKVAVEQLAYTRPQASVISLGMGTEILRQMLEKLLIGGLPVSQVMAETTVALEKEYNDSYK